MDILTHLFDFCFVSSLHDMREKSKRYKGHVVLKQHGMEDAEQPFNIKTTLME